MDAEVDLGTTRGAYGPRGPSQRQPAGLEREVAQTLVDAAHQLCPYSNATLGNIEVAINLVPP